MKVLITADIHINDYANYNYTTRSRLLSFEKLADRLVELAFDDDCEELWILGDLIDRPNARPYILHEAYKFMTILCKKLPKVRYILGNHDLDGKSDLLDVQDSLVTIFDLENLYYMDHKILELDGHTYGFMNWRPNQSLDWLGGKHLDVLFGHFTKSELFGQEIDESKFDLMIHGDIHNSQVIGKFVSVCNPIQKDMSSEQVGKVLIFDTQTMEWKRVETDPDHTRFLRISYTDDQTKEGFHGELQYNIYKPNIIVEGDTVEEKIITWNDVDNLIDETCKLEKLEDIHSEVISKSPQFQEIDFNFQPTYLKIHGYRSIVDFEVNLAKGDRIALLGVNGSGKSSIIRALQGIFLKNSELQYERSTFTDDVQIELHLVYQNKTYQILKGSTWGLTIDGAEQPYHGVRDFEADLYEKLPFLHYLDLFFLRSNISNLSDQFNPTRRIELISKFYRLDRIEAYSQKAIEICNDLNQEISELSRERDVKLGVVNHINQRLTELDSIKDLNKEQLQSEIDSYYKLRDRKKAHEIWVNNLNNLKSNEQEIEASCNKIRARLSFNYDQGCKDLKDLESQVKEINAIYEATFKKSVEFESDLKDLNSIESKGKELKAKEDKISSGKCPTCGSPLKDTTYKEMSEQLTKELEQLRSDWITINDKIQSHPKGRDSKEYYITALTELKSKFKELNDSKELLSNKVNSYEGLKSSLETEEARLEKLKSDIKKLDESKVDDCEVPLDLDKKVSDLLTTINKIDEYKRNLTEKESIDKDISNMDDSISYLTINLNRYQRYSELTSLTGEIYEKILEQLALKFTSTEVRYDVTSGVYRGKRFITFDAAYLSKGTYRPYESCSDGQKIICDLDFLEKLFSVNIGLLVLDEYLKHLDDNNFPMVCDILKKMQVNTIIISTHDSNFTGYTRRLLLSLDDIGRTNVECV